jgi:hypothetical protein
LNNSGSTRRGKDGEEDGLIQDYDTILKESALLTTFAGILFGFLLDISINAPEDEFAFIDRIILLVALFSITISVSLFVMPVVYHHVQYPYRDLEKFKVRSHRFIPNSCWFYTILRIGACTFIFNREVCCIYSCCNTIFVSLYIL